MKALLPLLLVLAAPVAAHEVRIEQSTAAATVVRLSYADGQPFAFEAYELYRAEANTPFQVGRTNAEGTLAFVPGSATSWRLKAFSADGHGVERHIQVAASPPSPPAGASAPRWTLALAGLGAILGIFGLIQLIARKKS